MSLSNEPSYTLIGQHFTTLTSSPGPYLLPSPERSRADIAKRFVAACRAYLEALILSELHMWTLHLSSYLLCTSTALKL